MKKNLLVIAMFLFITSIAFAQNNPYAAKFSKIDAYIDSIMKDWHVPGIGLAIVYKDQLIYSKGYGYRDLDKKLPFESNTLFPIASNSKLFTATVAATMDEEKMLDLDQPVKRYHPSLNFNNDELNAKVTLRDLLSHRTGLATYDGLWVNSSYTRDELVNKIQYIKPAQAFRDKYIYSNMMFTTAGSVLEKLSGKSWEDLVRQRILDPLNMKTTCFTQADMIKTNNYLLPYFEPDTNHSSLKVRTYLAMADALGPAGSMKSTLDDMSKWMIAQLNNGKFQGNQVISPSAIAETLIPNSISDRVGKYPELSNSLYGLGRSIYSYKGYKLTSHTGSIDGYYSNLTFVPEKQLAVFVVLNHEEAGSLRSVISYPILDQLLDLGYTPWVARYKKDYLDGIKNFRKVHDSISRTQQKNTHPSHALENYKGVYSNPAYGDIVIDVAANQLTLSLRNQKSVLYHFHYDQFITKEEKTDLPDFRITFFTNAKGEIDRIQTTPYGDPLADFIKKK